jgi:ABC-type nitrate/sulfonate/bicarbonate transport system substrate-binding protein
MSRWSELGALALVLLLLVGCAAPAPAQPPTLTPAPARPATQAPAPAQAATQAPPPAQAPAPTQPAAMRTVKIGYFGKTVTSWPLFSADKRGFASKEGVQLEQTSLREGNILAQGLISGQFDIVQNSFETSISSIIGGAPVKIIGVTTKAPPFQILALPEIKTFDDVRGKTVMVGDNNGSVRILVDRVLAKNGLTPADYKVVPGGGNTERFGALVSKQIQVTILSSPQDLQGVKQGFNVLARVPTYVGDMAYNGFLVRTEWAEKNRDTLVAFLRTIGTSTRWVTDPANRQAATADLAEFLGADPADAEKIYSDWIVDTDGTVFSIDGRLAPGGLDGLLEFYVSNGDLTPGEPLSRFWDPQYVDAAITGH